MIFYLLLWISSVISYPLTKISPQKHAFDQELSAKYLEASLNLTADPCADFFEFACGNWIVNNPIPPDLSMFSNLYKLRNRVHSEMKELYESSDVSTSRAINQLLLFYKTCMEAESPEDIVFGEMLGEETFKSWPLLNQNNWTLADFDLTDILLKLAKMRRLSVFFTVSVKTDVKNTTRAILHVEEGSLSLGADSRNYYLQKDKFSKQLNAVKQYFIDVTSFFASKTGVTLDSNYLKKEVEGVLEFETKIADFMLPTNQKNNITRSYNLRKLKDLQKIFTNIDWNRYVMSIVPSDLHDYVKSNPDVVISELYYFKRLTQLLNSSNSKVIANYIFLKFVANFKLQLGPQFGKIYQIYVREMSGQKELAPRWKDCVNLANANMKYASGALYNVKNSTMAMVSELQKEFLDMLKENNWMDKETRAVAENKAKRMQALIGYPPFIMDDVKLDDKYKTPNLLENDTLITMITKIHRYNMEVEFNRLLHPVDRTEWVMNPSMINAGYFSIQNAIAFPAAILQFPFFHKNFPRSLNYGAIGSVIGHEITHGFDNQGREYDANGYFRNWWDSATTDKYRQRAQCLLEQYGDITVPEVNLTIDGKLTLSENIADNGGIKESYRAYMRFLDNNGPEDPVEGFEQFSNKQLFFIGFAQTFCGHSTRQALIRSLLTNGHSPAKYRINVAVQNQPEFTEAFQCPKGTPMNPEKRCSVW